MKTKKEAIRPCTAWVLFTGTLVLINPAARAANYAETVLADKPVAYYRLEETDMSAPAVDSSETHLFPGTFFSSDAVYPKVGQPGIGTNSAYFKSYKDVSGASLYSYVEIPNAPELNPAGAFTAEAWVRPMSADTAGGYRAAVSSFGGWIADSPGWFFYQSPEAAASPSAWIWVMKGGGIWIQSGAIKKNTWQHLVGSFDGTRVTFYVDGQAIGSANVPGYVPNSTQPLFIGSGKPGAWLFDGYVDEVAIYDKPLTADQITMHYQVGLTNIRVGALPPDISEQPIDATQYAGKEVSFRVGATGTAPLAYQWYKGNNAITGATAEKLTFTAAMADNGSLYQVVITNSHGSATSSVAKLTVSTDLLLQASPASPPARRVGSAAAFRVVAGGAMPYSYQWYKGTTLIPDATNDVLWLYDLKPADDASTYYAKVQNPWNSTNSEPATLTVVARDITVPMTGYARIVALDQPIAYWRLNEANGDGPATDAVGSFDGVYDAAGAGQYTSTSFTFGEPTGIPRETDKAVSVSGGARVAVNWAQELNPKAAFTWEAWLKPATLSADDLDYRTAFSSEGSGPSGWLLYQQPNHTWAWVLYGGDWSTTTFIGAAGSIVANNWHHVVLSSDGNIFRVFINGQQVASREWGAYYVPNRDGRSNFGWRSLNDWKPFNGTIDEVAFYNKALTLEQAQAHYLATVRLSATTSGDSIILSWPLGTLQQSDLATGTYTDVPNATSPHTTSTTGTAKFFRVKVQ